MVLNARTSTVEKKKFFKNSINVLSAGSFIHVLLLILKLFHAFHNNSGHFAL